MRSIRRNTFETNSSSTHSISIVDDHRVGCKLPIEDNMYDEKWKGDGWEPDCLMVELTGFCSWHDHDSQNDRLALLCLLVCYQVMDESPHCLSEDQWNEYFLKVYDSDEWKSLEQEISEYADCRFIRVEQYSEGYIDHDSLEYDNIQEFLDMWDLGSVSDYVFANSIKTHFEFCG